MVYFSLEGERMAEEKEGYEVVAARLRLNIKFDTTDPVVHTRMVEQMSILQITCMPAEFAHKLADDLDRADFSTRLYKNFDIHRIAKETITNLKSRRDAKPQSLFAARAQGIADAMQDLDTAVVAEEDLEMDSPLSTRRYNPKGFEKFDK